jgi:hypothetical protein
VRVAARDRGHRTGVGHKRPCTPRAVARSSEFLALDAPTAMHGTALEMFG